MNSTTRLPIVIDYTYPLAKPSVARLEKALDTMTTTLTLQRFPRIPDEHLTIFSSDDGAVKVEYGVYHGPTLTTHVDRADLIDRITDWALAADGWQDVLGGTVIAEYVEPEPIDEDDVEPATELARELVLAGYRDYESVVEAVAETYEMDENQAAAIVDPIWVERAAEQRTWTGRSDNDRLWSAFSGLTGKGITAEEDFTCCLRCGVSEIAAEADERDHGFVFFHQQDTARAAIGGGLMLAYGAYGGDKEKTVEVGNTVVEALREAGLDPVWNGSADARIELPMEWRRQLPYM